MDLELKIEEQRVTERNRVLKKELGLRDLVLMQIVFVVGTTWVGAASKLGHAHIIFWVLAILFFYVPVAATVIYLNRIMPLEGGLYQWAKVAFNEFTGFMVAWNLWLLGILVIAGIGLVVATNLSYAIGPSADWMPGSKWFVSLISCALVFSLIIATVRGLALGKWIHQAGAVMLLITYGALIMLPYLGLARGTINQYNPLEFTIPSLSLYTLNIFSKLALGALSGFEYVAIMSGECHTPSRNIKLSVLIAAPIIALMFILGTSSVLALVKDTDINLIGPVPQALSLGFSSLSFVSIIAPIAILLMLGRSIALISIYFTGNTRLPMVAGWDYLLPAWFSRLHKTYRTPINSIIFAGIVTLIFALASLIGVESQESFQLIDNAGGVFYAVAYMVLFAIPIFGLRRTSLRASIWLRLAAACGFLVTLLFTALTIFPIIRVQSQTSFAIKIIAVTVTANVVGATIFLTGRRRRRHEGLPL